MSYEVDYQRQVGRPEWVVYDRPCPGGLASVVGIFFMEETARACAQWLTERKHGNNEKSDDHHREEHGR